jgi:hypothetical protein
VLVSANCLFEMGDEANLTVSNVAVAAIKVKEVSIIPFVCTTREGWHRNSTYEKYTQKSPSLHSNQQLSQ